MLSDFISLVYPKICAACNKSLYKGEHCICTSCRYRLPKTNFHLQHDNPVYRLFWGRVQISSAASFLQFSKGGQVQRLIHRLKYQGRREVGMELGKLYGADLRQAPLYRDINLVVPVPLHKSKLARRKYNQSALFAEGLASVMNTTMDMENLYRQKATDTQTRKSRFGRWENVDSIFSIKDPEVFENKHVLLVDDVITTGSTVEACAQELLKSNISSVSVVTIAYA